MINYVLGFLFNPSLTHVVLIKKNRPKWQAGKLNGIGGHVEPGETFHEAMVREFKEETGLGVDQWNRFGTMVYPQGDGAIVGLFYATSDKYAEVESRTDEVVQEISLTDLSYSAWSIFFLEIIPNVRWLISMALSFARYGEPPPSFTITEAVTPPEWL